MERRGKIEARGSAEEARLEGGGKRSKNSSPSDLVIDMSRDPRLARSPKRKRDKLKQFFVACIRCDRKALNDLEEDLYREEALNPDGTKMEHANDFLADHANTVEDDHSGLPPATAAEEEATRTDIFYVIFYH